MGRLGMPTPLCQMCVNSPATKVWKLTKDTANYLCASCYKGMKVGKKNERPPQETKFVPCTLCGAVTSEYEITVTQISTGRTLAVLSCCAECAGKAA